jgi:hypothetical protein
VDENFEELDETDWKNGITVFENRNEKFLDPDRDYAENKAKK